MVLVKRVVSTFVFVQRVLLNVRRVRVFFEN